LRGQALRAYRETHTKAEQGTLTEFAQINRVQKVMGTYLEAVPRADAISAPPSCNALLNKSRTQSRPFQELLQYFAMESDSCIGLQNRQTRIGSY
jgi:hypothetical protein